MKRGKITRNGLTLGGEVRVCAHCGEEFVAIQEYRSFKRKYCSPRCTGDAKRERVRAAYPPREEVWTAYEVEGVSDATFGKRHGHTYQWAFGVRRHYGIEAIPSDEKERRKRGGSWTGVHSHGYIVVRHGTGRDEYEHRLVAERKLGRPLEPGEVVHHIDGDRANNDPGNLQVFASAREHMLQAHSQPKKPPKSRTGNRALARVFNLELKGETACRNCGQEGQLHLHHAIPRSKCAATKTNLLNGLPLCPRCHSGWHQRVTVICRDVFTKEEWAFLVSVQLTGEEIMPWLDKRYPERLTGERWCPVNEREAA